MIAQADKSEIKQPFLFDINSKDLDPPVPVIEDDDREYFPTPEPIAEFAISTFATGGRMVLDAGAGAGVWGLTAKRLNPNRFVVGVDVPGVKPVPGYSFWFSKGFELAALSMMRLGIQVDDALGNPPFSRAGDFIGWTWPLLRDGGRLIYFLRLAYLAGQTRAREFWPKYPVRAMSVSAQRPSFTGDGVSDPKTEYMVVVLEKGYTGPKQLLSPFIYDDRSTWIAPRKEFVEFSDMWSMIQSVEASKQKTAEMFSEYLVSKGKLKCHV